MNLIKNIADCERPYEKAMRYGVETLSDAELLSIIIRNGTRDISSLDLANQVMNVHFHHKGLTGLNFISREELKAVRGIGDIKATELLALPEISKRMNETRLKENICFTNPSTIAKYYMEKCKYHKMECTYAMYFNNSYSLIKETMLTRGTVNSSLISPREIYIEALKYEAVNIILVHNHPSGNVEPSNADIAVTKKILEAGKLIDISLSDHIIVGNGVYTSMHERGYLK